MFRLIFLLLTVTPAAAGAEVYKCIEKLGRTVYQSSPCKAAIKEQQLNITPNPAKEAEAKAKLQAIQSEDEARKAAQQQADKELSAERYEAAQLEIANRSAIAQQEQAEAQKRQAEALENQNQMNNSPIYVLPPISPRKPVHPAVPLPIPRQRNPYSN